MCWYCIVLCISMQLKYVMAVSTLSPVVRINPILCRGLFCCTAGYCRSCGNFPHWPKSNETVRTAMHAYMCAQTVH